MKEIKLTQGKITLVDDADFEWLNQWKWLAFKGLNTFYAARKPYKATKLLFIHRELLCLTDPKIYTDHIDLNGLNNQRNNLRKATASQNCSNRIATKNSYSKYLGVTFKKQTGRWCAGIEKFGKSIHLGYFDKEEDAAEAYNLAAVIHHGEFARLNII